MKFNNVPDFLIRLKDTDLDDLSLSEIVSLKLYYVFSILNISQLSFAILINVSLSYLHEILNCESSISIKKLDYICSKINIPLTEFVDIFPLNIIKDSNEFIILKPYDKLVNITK